MKGILWTIVAVTGFLGVGLFGGQLQQSRVREEMTQRDIHRAIASREGQPRHWRACMLKSR